MMLSARRLGATRVIGMIPENAPSKMNASKLLETQRERRKAMAFDILHAACIARGFNRCVLGS
ncbi:hypothetical protein DT23_17870 [Thioclava indica]|uniref:Uncharacterized protein n=1 Tax=Thioclava indica TaxID=1353528 RepID=A0A074K0W2_9RHOB|nr:hypothetical protein DT23_17870 [Thioclava indica]